MHQTSIGILSFLRAGKVPGGSDGYFQFGGFEVYEVGSTDGFACSVQGLLVAYQLQTFIDTLI